jgi:hypothetical protein
MLNAVRDLINLLANTGSIKMTGDTMKFENKYGRFLDYAPVEFKERKKHTWVLPQLPWAADPSEIEFIDTHFPSLIRLPKSISNGGRCPKFFSDTLTFADAQLFFSGLGEVILRLLPSIETDQRRAYIAFIRGIAPVYYPVIKEDDLAIKQVCRAVCVNCGSM